MNTMRIFLLLFLLTAGFSIQAQVNQKVQQTSDASYPGGDEALYNYVFHNLKYSEESKKNKVEGHVMVSFMVETDSTLSKIVIIQDPGFGVGEGVKEMLSKIKYIPARMNGVPMKSKVVMNIPVRAH